MFHLILVAILATSYVASAETSFYVNGSRVESEGAAVRAAMKDPKASVVKVQASYVELNNKTMKMKKSDDISTDELKKLIK